MHFKEDGEPKKKLSVGAATAARRDGFQTYLCALCGGTHASKKYVRNQQTSGSTPIEDLIERSSLGTPGAKALRSRTPPEVVDRIMRKAGYEAPKSGRRDQ
jgi:hypothetical protein